MYDMHKYIGTQYIFKSAKFLEKFAYLESHFAFFRFSLSIKVLPSNILKIQYLFFLTKYVLLIVLMVIQNWSLKLILAFINGTENATG